jgi:hypothetical protein
MQVSRDQLQQLLQYGAPLSLSVLSWSQQNLDKRNRAQIDSRRCVRIPNVVNRVLIAVVARPRTLKFKSITYSVQQVNRNHSKYAK